MEVHGLENIPQTGGVILAANHRSYADPPLVGCHISRQVHFLAKMELFQFRPFGWLITNLNAHPLNRSGSDVSALKTAKRVLEEGNTMIVFPEGRRNRSNVLGQPKAGIGLLAKMAGCPVVPVYIHNSAEMIFFKKISIYFGKPLLPEQFNSNQDIADAVMSEIQRMKEKKS